MVPVLNTIGTDVSCVGVSIMTVQETYVLTAHTEPRSRLWRQAVPVSDIEVQIPMAACKCA